MRPSSIPTQARRLFPEERPEFSYRSRQRYSEKLPDVTRTNEGFPNSNGHGRASAGFVPTARQSNLVVEVDKAVSRQQLKQMLLDQMKQQNKPFGLVLDEIEGGFTMTTRMRPNAFSVLPVMVYKVSPHGTEELVRGVDLIGTPLTVFSKIIAADDEKAVFNGFCGAQNRALFLSRLRRPQFSFRR